MRHVQPAEGGVQAKGSGVLDMGSFSAWHWLIVLVVLLLFFGKGKIPELMGDLAHGIRAFKKGVEDEKDDTSLS
jgi:sec-independent protein translocase protein TatA